MWHIIPGMLPNRFLESPSRCFFHKPLLSKDLYRPAISTISIQPRQSCRPDVQDQTKHFPEVLNYSSSEMNGKSFPILKNTSAILLRCDQDFPEKLLNSFGRNLLWQYTKSFILSFSVSSSRKPIWATPKHYQKCWFAGLVKSETNLTNAWINTLWSESTHIKSYDVSTMPMACNWDDLTEKYG